MLSSSDAAAEVMSHLIYHDGDGGHGYSQYERDGNGDMETITLSDGTNVTVHAHDYDCSSAAIGCYEYLGISCGGASYTGNMHDGFLGSGNFIEISPFDAENGDVLLDYDGHTEMCLYHDGQYWQGGFRISELGTIYGDRGDQTGWESTESPINVYQWDTAFRCIAPRPGQAPAKPVPSQRPSEPLNSYGFSYRAHCENVGWCEPVRDGQVAGTVGYAARLEAIKCTPIAGMTLDFMLHIQDNGDTWYRGVKLGAYDPVMGTEGQAKRVEGLQVNVTARDGDARGKTLYYRCHIRDQGWTGWTREGNYCGTRGKGLRVEAIQMMLVVEQEYSEPVNSNGVKYRVHTQDYGWLPEVHDGMVAGTTGQSRRIEAIQLTDLPEGLELDLHAHIENVGDMAYDHIRKGNAPIIGTVGRSLRLEAFAIHVLKNSTGKRLCYAGHQQDTGWTRTCHDGEPCGQTGRSLRMEAIKLWLE